jgi:hypothetical protein
MFFHQTIFTSTRLLHSGKDTKVYGALGMHLITEVTVRAAVLMLLLSVPFCPS